MVNSTSLFSSQCASESGRKDSKVVEIGSEKLMTPSKDAVFFVQLFARAYRHSS